MPKKDIVEEAKRILELAEQQAIILRLFGGVAVRFQCPSATYRKLQRDYADIDLIGLKKQSGEIKSLVRELGYDSREVFNAFQGDRRLIFNDLENERRLDIFLDNFEMCHRLKLKERLILSKTTISLADLLATKLQVVELTEREYKDVIALVHDHEIIGLDQTEAINGSYLANLAADDWGMYKTFSMNIANILAALPRFELDQADQKIVHKRLDDLQARFEETPKTMRWKLRALIGEKVRWYELPEPDREIVDSRINKT
ncbi:MAG: hypothetical protein ABSF09_10775 [Candidatus Bathyarchaeia archaeon]|jgi:hypothetical protein